MVHNHETYDLLNRIFECASQASAHYTYAGSWQKQLDQGTARESDEVVAGYVQNNLDLLRGNLATVKELLPQVEALL